VRPPSPMNETSTQSGQPKSVQVVESWRAPDVQSIELHSGSAISEEYPRHWHDELYLCAVIEGGGDLNCVGTSYSTPPGALVLIPPGDIHSNSKRQCTFRCMFIDVLGMQKAMEQHMEHPVPEINFRTELIRNAQTTVKFLRLHRFLKGQRLKLGRDSSLLLFFHRLLSRHSTASIPSVRDGNEDFAVQRARRFLDEHYAEQVSLQDLARLTGLSPYYLHRSFCRKIGMPPHAYQVQVRISHARAQLRRGRSISEVAFSAGFVDQSHFSRHFKRLTGVTPGQFLNKEQERTRRPLSPAINSFA
jgi:AraC-like DNA-binding protein